MHVQEMRLKDAVDHYKKEENAPANAYGWYRQSAKKDGSVSIGAIEVPAFKSKGVWCVDEKRFAEAIHSHRRQVKFQHKMTADYEKGIIHGEDGDSITTDWGHYEIHGNFYFAYNLLRAQHGGGSSWYCSQCKKPAKLEHKRPRCHLCEDWNGCGSDCTLSRVYCQECGISLKVNWNPPS